MKRVLNVLLTSTVICTAIFNTYGETALETQLKINQNRLEILPQSNTGNEGGEITLKPSSSSFSDVNFDNVAGDGRIFFNSSDDRTLSLFNDGGGKADLHVKGNLKVSGSEANDALLTVNGTVETSNDMKVGTGLKVGTNVYVGNIITVENSIFTKHIQVQKSINVPDLTLRTEKESEWADFVFDADYKLKSLTEVEAFIKENKHLPDVPSAKDVVEAGGFNVAEMNKILLQKVEELTLHMIAMEKKNTELESKLKEVVSSVSSK